MSYGLSKAEAWRPDYIGDETGMVALDEDEVEMSRRRRQVGPLTPPIATQSAFPLLDLVRARLRGG
jgi:hypothetical protein